MFAIENQASAQTAYQTLDQTLGQTLAKARSGTSAQKFRSPKAPFCSLLKAALFGVMAPHVFGQLKKTQQPMCESQAFGYLDDIASTQVQPLWQLPEYEFQALCGATEQPLTQQPLTQQLATQQPAAHTTQPFVLDTTHLESSEISQAQFESADRTRLVLLASFIVAGIAAAIKLEPGHVRQRLAQRLQRLNSNTTGVGIQTLAHAQAFAFGLVRPIALSQASCALAIKAVSFLLQRFAQDAGSGASAQDTSLYALRGAALIGGLNFLTNVRAISQTTAFHAFNQQVQRDQRANTDLGLLVQEMLTRITGPLVGALISRSEQTLFETAAVIGISLFIQVPLSVVADVASNAMEQQGLDLLNAMEEQQGQVVQQHFPQQNLPQQNPPAVEILEVAPQPLQQPEPAPHQQVVPRARNIRRLMGQFLGTNQAQTLKPQTPIITAATRIHQKLGQLATVNKVPRHELEDLLPSFLEHLFVCPISLQIMTDPVSLPCENTSYVFERKAAKEWIEASATHPVLVQTPVARNTLLPSYKNLQGQIEAWVDYELGKQRSK